MSTFQSKMFRDKPYTQCFECIQGQRMKCKKCMENMVESVLHHRSCAQKEKTRKMESSKKGWRESKQIVRTGCSMRTRMSQEDSCEVNTVYGLWMERLKTKNSKHINVLDLTLSQWTHKKAMKTQKIEKFEKPKFENWEARLLQRFSQTSLKRLGQLNRTSNIR